jgi:DNA-binding beta-propeller fold protein YncE
VGEGSVWVTNLANGTVVQIDPETAKPGRTHQVGSKPDEITVGEGAVFVTLADDDAVAKIQV